MQSYTTNNSNLQDSARFEINQARSWNPELARPYISLEAKKMQEVGQSVDWLRQVALISDNYNRKRVDELSPASNKSIVGSINQAIFGTHHQTVNPYDKTVQLLHAEAKLGGEFFGGDSSVATHQFFSFTPDKWIYFEHKTTGLFKTQDTMITYDITGGNIRKLVDGNILSMSQEETDNLMLTLNAYVSYVGTSLYPAQYKTLLDWQAQQANQVSVLSQTGIRNSTYPADQTSTNLDEQRLSYWNIRYDDMNEPGDFALAA